MIALATSSPTPSTIPQPPPEPLPQVETATASRPPRLLSKTEVLEMIGFKTTYLYALIKQGRFPKPVRLGKMSRWWEHEVVAFMESLPRETWPSPLHRKTRA